MLTTTNPRLWFTLSALLLAFICLGGSCLGIAAMVGGDESDFLMAANKMSKWGMNPFPEQAVLWRRLSPPTQEEWAALAKAARKKSEDWNAVCRETKALKVPPRLKEVASALDAGESQVRALFDQFIQAVERKEQDEARRAREQVRRRLRALRQEVEGILQRIYQPDAMPSQPSGVDPARPPGV